MVNAKQKKVLLTWSGGLDSTFMIFDYLRRGYHVDVVYARFKNSYGKTAREEKAIDAMFTQYFSNFNVKRVNTIEVSLGSFTQSLCLTQVPSWLLALISSVDQSHDEVALGYVMNDDAVSFLDDIRTVWNSYQGLMHYPLPPLVFPLIKKQKNYIYRELPEVLRANVMWCESGDEADKCGMCRPCRRMIELGLMEKPTMSDKHITEEIEIGVKTRRKKKQKK